LLALLPLFVGALEHQVIACDSAHAAQDKIDKALRSASEAARVALIFSDFRSERCAGSSQQ